jgi:AcrR family transcriptional regulator
MAAGRGDYMEAMVDLAFERGYEQLSIAEIARHAGGDEAGFESFFPSKQACAIAALEEMAADNLATVREAFANEPRWPDSLRAAAYAQARWIVAQPRKMHFGMMEILRAGELAAAVRDRLIGEYVAMVDAGREVAEDPASVPPMAAESVIGSIAQVMSRNSEKVGEVDPFAVVPEMMYLAVRPYLGEEAARKELTIPPPAS